MEQDIYNLDRFVKEHQRTYSTALNEVSQGMKRSHWMWWIFPQIAGLGMTSTSQTFSIRSLEEAKAFLAHPYLGGNLREISNVLDKFYGGKKDERTLNILQELDTVK